MSFHQITLALLALLGLIGTTLAINEPRGWEANAQPESHAYPYHHHTCSDMVDEQACLAGQLQDYMDGLDRRDALPFLIARDAIPSDIDVRSPGTGMIERESFDGPAHEDDNDSVAPMFTNSRNGRGWKRDKDDGEVEAQFTSSRNGKGWKRDHNGGTDDPEAQFTNSRNGKGWRRDEIEAEEKQSQSNPEEQFTNSRTGKGFKREERLMDARE